MSARILFGLGWVAFQQGQLLRAEQLLHSARGNLLLTPQHHLRLVVETHLWMATRRRTSFDSPQYQEVLDVLATQYKATVATHEGMRHRCVFELARGYMDLAEFGKSESMRGEYLTSAQEWLCKIEPHSNPQTAQRLHLHRARWLMLMGDADIAERELNDARGLATETGVEQRATIILDAALSLQKNDYEKATDLLKRALSGILSISQEDQQSNLPHDPVMEAECYILLARAYLGKNENNTARDFLEKWLLMSQFVDNRYLQYLARVKVTRKLAFRLDFDFPVHCEDGDQVENLSSRLDKFEAWMINSIRERNPRITKTELAFAYGLTPSHFGRKLREKGLVNSK